MGHYRKCSISVFCALSNILVCLAYTEASHKCNEEKCMLTTHLRAFAWWLIQSGSVMSTDKVGGTETFRPSYFILALVSYMHQRKTTRATPYRTNCIPPLMRSRYLHSPEIHHAVSSKPQTIILHSYLDNFSWQQHSVSSRASVCCCKTLTVFWVLLSIRVEDKENVLGMSFKTCIQVGFIWFRKSLN